MLRWAKNLLKSTEQRMPSGRTFCTNHRGWEVYKNCLIWCLTFLRRGQVCFHMHFCGPHTFVQKKCCWFQMTLPQKPLGQCCSNFRWSLLGPGKQKVAKLVLVAPVHFTHFTLTFNISSTIRPTTTKPCIVLLLNVRTPQVPWLGDLDLYLVLHWLLHLLRRSSVYPQL